jgi:hypothetical protein
MCGRSPGLLRRPEHALVALLALAALAHGQEGVVESAPAPAEPETPRWIDPEDGWFDLSSFLVQPHGFVPLLVPITEPALGYGVGGGLVFLDPREDAGSEGWARPNITAVGGLWTEGGSEGGFAGNSSLWSGGDLQTLVAGGVVSLDLELHGIGADRALDDAPLDYTLDVLGLVGEGRTRLGESDFWLALRFAWAEATVDFEGDFPAGPDLDPSDDDVVIAGPTVSVRYDSLDNVLTPTRGTLSESMVSAFDDAFGGSQDFQLVQQVLVHHAPLSERFFLGARADVDLSFGETPFYARPYIALRGIPALRYQGEHVASAELELRWQFHPRFGLVGFGGYGLAWTNFESFDREQDAFTQGAGFRYLVARRFGLHMGLDVARGPEDGAIYVQFGNAWLRP